MNRYSHDEYTRLVGTKKNKYDYPENEYKDRFIPETLFKYQSFDSPHIDDNLALLMQGKIWMPLAKELNDPFEFQMCSDNLSTTDRIQIREDILGRNSVLSLAKSCKQNLMWSHYANAHRGYCVEFEVEDKGYIFPITYLRWPIDCTKDIDKWLKIKKNILENAGACLNVEERIALENVLKIMLYKCSDWKYECEFRITSRTLCETDSDDIPTTGYVEKLSNIGLRVKSIILGFNCSQVNKGRVIQYVNNRNHQLVVNELIRTDYKYPVENIIETLISNGDFISIKQMIRQEGKITLQIKELGKKNGIYV